jgi:hypothetical protein
MVMDPGSGPGAGGAAPGAGGYEFLSTENAIIATSGARARAFGALNIIAGVVMILGGLAIAATLGATRAEMRVVGYGVAVAALVPLIAGPFYLRAGKAFSEVVRTEGNDIALMLTALTHLRNAVRVEGIATILAFVGGLVAGGIMAGSR